MSGRYRRMVDLVELTGLLQATTSGVSIDQIAERFEVSRRTAERMLEALRERFPSVEPELRNGRKYWMLQGGEFGRPLQLSGELQQLAARVAELEARSEKEAIADHVLASSTVGIFLLDSDFRVVWVNAALEKLFAISAGDVIGQDKRKLIEEKVCRKFVNSEEFKRRVFATYDDNTYIEHFQCHRLPDDGNAGIWLEHWSQPIESGPYAGGRLEHYLEIPEPGSRLAAAEAARSTGTDDGSSAKQLAGSLSELIESARRGLDGSLDPESALREIRSVVERLEDIVDDE